MRTSSWAEIPMSVRYQSLLFGIRFARRPDFSTPLELSSLRTILSKLFSLVTTNFFDDFCEMELNPAQKSAWSTAEGVLRPLG